MEIYIFGAGKLGQYVCKDLLKSNQMVLGFIDNDVTKIGRLVGTIKVIAAQEVPLEIRQTACVLVAAFNEVVQAEIISQLEKMGFKNVYLISALVWRYGTSVIKNGKFDNRYAIKVVEGENGDFLPVLPYLETHIMDGGCLNCSGCSHFSNLFAMNAEVPIEQYKSDLEQLGKMCNIRRLRILGGEPLLNRHLLEYLKIARESFPHAGLRVVTNGLLILKTPGEVFDYMAEQNIELIITLYQPAYKMRDKIIERLCSHSVEYIMTKENCDVFDKVLTLNGNHDEEEIIASCRRKTCLNLRNGKLYRCAISAYVYKFNEIFGTNIESQSIFNIYENSVDQLKEFAMGKEIKPVNTCKYCTGQAVEYVWRTSTNPTMEEWLVDESSIDN